MDFILQMCMKLVKLIRPFCKGLEQQTTTHGEEWPAMMLREDTPIYLVTCKTHTKLKVCRFCESWTIFLWDIQWCSLPTPNVKLTKQIGLLWFQHYILSSDHYMGLYICLCFISQEKTLMQQHVNDCLFPGSFIC